MDAGVIIGAATAVVAAVALLLSVRQIALLRRQNLSPVVLDAFREARSDEWFVAFDWIRTELGREHPPERGVSGLPEFARSHVRKVGFFYDNLGHGRKTAAERYESMGLRRLDEPAGQPL
jgi:hypothetical protein